LRILRDFPSEMPPAPEYPVVTIGVFDGLHRGHERILETARTVAAGRLIALVTFDPHPRAVLGPPKHHRLLSPIPERLDLLAAWPLAAVAILRFDRTIAGMHYRDFVRQMLVEGLGARVLVLGYNIRVGHERQGTPERLAELGRELGFEVEIVPAVEVDGEVASSTRIRHLLDAGEVDRAARVLGRPYSLRGTVVRGDGRGRGLGLPTANLDVPSEKLVPANGVYAVWVQVGTERLPGALNIGVVPTFQDAARRTLEVHLLGFQGDLYGARLDVELVKRLRPERRFRDAQALLAQIQLDLEAARAALGNAPS
jgi:riboflavin kinase / FMN adenylyltransferase